MLICILIVRLHTHFKCHFFSLSQPNKALLKSDANFDEANFFFLSSTLKISFDEIKMNYSLITTSCSNCFGREITTNFYFYFKIKTKIEFNITFLYC